MHDGSVLDLAEIGASPRSSSARAARPRLVAAAVLGGFVALAGAGLLLVQASRAADADRAAVRLDLAAISQVEAMNVDDKAQIIAEGTSAQERNAAIPLDAAPLGQVAGFTLAATQGDAYATALKCLTQAVYYEAAVEPLEGRRAVAQVVLNRMRHPGYPKSICGVVYQGSERRTGCQFSFTCDGSLLRAPAARPWREAAEVARMALAGHVEKSVGTATHYHADYVLPKWAFQLGKITTLGRHIFYRFHGRWGKAAALSGRYAMVERIPAINFAALSDRLEDQGGDPALAEAMPGLTVPPHVTDRHAASDVGGRLDTTKQWRLSIPDPVQASSNYRATLDGAASPAPHAPAQLVLNADGQAGRQP